MLQNIVVEAVVVQFYQKDNTMAFESQFRSSYFYNDRAINVMYLSDLTNQLGRIDNGKKLALALRFPYSYM